MENDRPAIYKQTYFPEAEGLHCELVRRVPYRPNTMLVFLNSRGAHGAEIPADAATPDRYTYQFYIAPDTQALRGVLRSLPRERRELWQAKDRVR